jgi:1,4-alpha-glucan branching enzyme
MAQILFYANRTSKEVTMTDIRDDGTVEFRFYRPLAGNVKVAGDFSDWGHNAIPMQAVGEGWWTTRLALRPGEYRFRYIADGNWFTDFASHGIEICQEGWNSVLFISRSHAHNMERNNISATSAAA